MNHLSKKVYIANYAPFLIDTNPGELKLKKSKTYSLLYHSFSNDSFPHYYNTIEYFKFYNDILKLKSYFSFENNLEEINEKSLYITFDDGYKSILPVLEFCERNSIKTNIFVNSFSEVDNILPKDKIQSVFRNSKKGDRLTFNGNSITIKNTSPYFREYLSMTVNRHALNTLNYEQYIIEADKFYKEYIKDTSSIDSDLELLSDEDLRYIDKELPSCKIGSHGYSHFNLNKIQTREEINLELNQSKDYLEKLINKPIDYFSYPYGFYDDNIESECRASGYKKALTIEPGPFEELGAIKGFSLPRVVIDKKNILLEE